jgi:hypothetical protein
MANSTTVGVLKDTPEFHDNVSGVLKDIQSGEVSATLICNEAEHSKRQGHEMRMG